jgi:hypothetical protein
MNNDRFRRIGCLAILLVPTLSFCQTTPSISQKSDQSTCSNIVALTGSANINCSSLTPKQQQILKSIPVLLKKILDAQPDLVGLKIEMNQIYALVQANSASPDSGATISIDNGSSGNVISGTRAINVPLKVKVDHQSDRNMITDNEAIKDCVVADIPHQIVKYKDVSNESLRGSVIGFANQLREFASSTEQEDEKQRDERIEHMRKTVDPRNITPEEARKLGEEGREIDEQNQAHLAALIREKYLGQATEFREELKWRLQKASLLPAESFTEMVYTFWPSPVGDPELDVRTVNQTAAYLENLARQLP